ncbi:frizzled-5-like [Brevipalpus obovatus]|uniref:frizzled-5-like n=1 Tax=Brevipalpus obovatus TaxID=246614 RepID=UPI003D9ECE55
METNKVMMILSVLLIGFLIFPGGINSASPIPSSGAFDEPTVKCEVITLPMCQGIGYNMTSMPNQFHHEKQEEAGLEAHQFLPLVGMKCSDDLQFFLCSMYTPICMEEFPGHVPPCRSVCERARHGCESIMRRNGFTWPEFMECKNFPNFGTEKPCMDNKEGKLPQGFQAGHRNRDDDEDDEDDDEPFYPSHSIGTDKSRSWDKMKPIDILPSSSNPQNPVHKGNNFDLNPSHHHVRPGKGIFDPGSESVTPNVGHGGLVSEIPSYNIQCQCKCVSPMVRLNNSHHHAYYNIIETGGQINCGQPCDGVFFTKSDQSSASRIINIFAFLCLLCSLLVLFTFMADTGRFRYPERAIICLSGCYAMVSLGFLLRLVIGSDSVACDGNGLVRYLNSGISGSAPCVAIFFLIYYFTMAASLWWVILTLTWFLSTGLQWGRESLSNYSMYFHLLTWGIPFIKSFIIVASDSVDGEPLIGICMVGNHDVHALMRYVIVPLCIYLSIGFTLLMAGFISLFRIRNIIRQQVRTKSEKHALEKLMVRIVIFSILYILPTIAVICCNWYEYHHRPIWERNHNCPCTSRTDVPFVRLNLLKYCMILGIGIATCGWIMSGKTVDSWNRCIEKCCCCDKRRSIGSCSHGHGASGHHTHHPFHPHHTHSLAGSGNSQRSYKQINYIAQVQSNACRKISLSHV